MSLIGFRDEKTGPNPMGRAKKGVKRNLLNEADAISTGLVIGEAQNVFAIHATVEYIKK